MTEPKIEHEQWVRGLVSWVEDQRREWQAHDASFDDDFWRTGEARLTWTTTTSGAISVAAAEGGGSSDIHKTQVNLGRPWVTSLMASLYYGGIYVTVEADELPHQGETTDALSRRTNAIRELLNRWLGSSPIEAVSERLLTMSLLYRGGCAYRLTLCPTDERRKGQSAVDLVEVEAVPPWECVWDRRTRTDRGRRYFGHIRQEPEEYVKRMGDLPEGAQGSGLVDFMEGGYMAVRRVEEDPVYHWVLTLDVPDESLRVGSATVAGVRRQYLVDGVNSGATLRLLSEGPMPYTEHDGAPLSDMVPLIVEPIARCPWDSIAPYASVYELNAELNRSQSIVAGQVRRDAARILAVKDGMSDETKAKIANARDLEMIPIPGNLGLPRDAVHVLDLGTTSETLIKYVGMVRDGLDRSQIIADVARGKAGQYLSAEEARGLIEYTQATIGRIRKRSDKALSHLCSLYLRVLSAAMEETGEESIAVTIDVDGKRVSHSVRPADLQRRWRIAVIDTASSPAEGQRRMADFQAALPTLRELVASQDPPNPEGAPSPTLQAFDRASYEFLKQRLHMPENFDLSTLRATASAAQPAPPVTPPSPTALAGPGGQLPPEESERLAESPAAQAIMGAAEQGAM